jgi:hypothetical protein
LADFTKQQENKKKNRKWKKWKLLLGKDLSDIQKQNRFQSDIICGLSELFRKELFNKAEPVVSYSDFS